MARRNLPWPYFRGLWTGITYGVAVGIWFGVRNEVWFTNRFDGSTIWFVIAGLIALVAFLPDTIAQVLLGIRRYRSAAK